MSKGSQTPRVADSSGVRHLDSILRVALVWKRSNQRNPENVKRVSDPLGLPTPREARLGVSFGGCVGSEASEPTQLLKCKSGCPIPSPRVPRKKATRSFYGLRWFGALKSVTTLHTTKPVPARPHPHSPSRERGVGSFYGLRWFTNPGTNATHDMSEGRTSSSCRLLGSATPRLDFTGCVGLEP